MKISLEIRAITREIELMQDALGGRRLGEEVLQQIRKSNSSHKELAGICIVPQSLIFYIRRLHILQLKIKESGVE